MEHIFTHFMKGVYSVGYSPPVADIGRVPRVPLSVRTIHVLRKLLTCKVQCHRQFM